MKTKLPDKVREGDELSARWLNQSVDFIKELASFHEDSSKNGDLPITSTGVSTLNRDTRAREANELDDIPTFTHTDFQVRIKPKHHCQVKDDGSYTKIIQVHNGYVIDYHGQKKELIKNEDGSEEASGDADWQDFEKLQESPVEVYLLVKQDSDGAITEISLSPEKPEEEKYWEPKDGKESDGFGSGGGGEIGGKGLLCLHLATVKTEVVEELRRIYITQHHTGPVELQVVNVAKFVASEGEEDGGGTPGGSVSGSGEETSNKPIGLFRERKVNAFYFKRVKAEDKEGIIIKDGGDITYSLHKAHYVPKGGESSGSCSEIDSGGEDDYPLGGVLSIDYDFAVQAPCIKKGAVLLSLANYSPEDESESSSEDGEVESPTKGSGGIRKVDYDVNVKAPRINEGAIKLSLAHFTPGEDDGGTGGDGTETDESSDGSGGIKSIAFAENIKAPAIEHGAIKIPLADTKDESAGVTGGISGINISFVDIECCSCEQDRNGSGRGFRSALGGSADPEFGGYIEKGVIYLTLPMPVAAGCGIGSGCGSGSDSGSGSGSGNGSGFGSNQGSDSGSQSGSSSGSSQGSSPGSSSGSGSGGGSSCNCADDRQKLWDKLNELEQAINDLKNGSGCECKCHEKVVEALKAEIDAKISSISLSGSVQQEVETTSTGTLYAVAQVNVTGNGGTSSINFKY